MRRLLTVVPKNPQTSCFLEPVEGLPRQHDSLTRRGGAFVATLLEIGLLIVTMAGVSLIIRQLTKPPNARSPRHATVLRPLFRLSALSDGRYLWAQRGLNEIVLIDIETGLASTCLSERTSMFTEACVSSDGRTSLVVIEDNELRIFRDEYLLVVDSAFSDANSLYRLSANGEIGVRLINGTLLRGWEVGTGEVQQFESTLPQSPTQIALDASGENTFALNVNGPPTLYETKTGRLLKTLDRYETKEVPTAVPVFTSDGSGIAVAYGSTVVLYDLADGKIVWTTKTIEKTLGFEDLASSNDGRWIAAGGVSSGIAVFDRNTGHLQCQFSVLTSSNRIVFSTSSDRLYSGSSDGSIKVFSLSDGDEIEPICKSIPE